LLLVPREQKFKFFIFSTCKDNQKFSLQVKSPKTFIFCLTLCQPSCPPLCPPELPLTWWRLHAGGGIGKARTRANDDITCSVSDESAPPLA